MCDAVCPACPPLPFKSNLLSFDWGRLGRSVDAMSQILKLGNVSLHQVQSDKSAASRPIKARPRRASAAASRSSGSRRSWTGSVTVVVENRLKSEKGSVQCQEA